MTSAKSNGSESLAADYSGPFDPDWSLAHLSRQALCTLGREYLLLGHLVDRIAEPLAYQRFGEEAEVQIAIEEWSRRARRAHGSGFGAAQPRRELRAHAATSASGIRAEQGCMKPMVGGPMRVRTLFGDRFAEAMSSGSL